MPDFQNTGFEDNPYRSPLCGSDVVVVDDESGQVVTARVLSALRQTQPWVRFLSVLGFVCSTLMVLIGSIGFVAMTTVGDRADTSTRFLFLVYLPMGVLYFVPSLFLFRYASRIKALRTTRNVRQLEDALEAQKSFWKFVGILAIIVITLYLLLILLAFVLAATHALH
jgi:hypothetical protein